MGISCSREGHDTKGQTYKEFTIHPLLTAIENPINRFADDFASFLVGGGTTQKPELPTGTHGIEPIGGYTIKKLLGKGAEAEVYLGQKHGHPPVAIKKYIECQNMDGNIPREVKIAKMLDHPHCIQLIESFEFQGNHIVFMPLATNGELVTSNVPVMTVLGAAHFLYQIGGAVAHMHSRNVVHRDIKTQNILVFEDGYCLIDYSVSVALNAPDDLVSGRVGTLIYMAPEISNNNYAPKPVDMWALGITVYVILFGRFPYALDQMLEIGKQTVPIAQLIIGHDLTFPEKPVIPEELKNIIRSMLDKNPSERLTADELVNHPWILEKVEEREKLRRYLQGG